MTEELVTFETAKLAREKGFDEPCFYAFVDREQKVKEVNPVMGHNAFDLIVNQFKLALKNPSAMQNLRDRIENHLVVNSHRASNCYARPTQDLLERWLREKHNCYVQCEVAENKWHYTISDVRSGVVFYDSSVRFSEDGLYFPTYELAREAALQHALKLLP